MTGRTMWNVLFMSCVQNKDSALCFHPAWLALMMDRVRLWRVYAQFPHSGAQRAAVEPKDFGGPVFSTDLPLRLFEDPHNMVALNRFQRFLCRR